MLVDSPIAKGGDPIPRVHVAVRVYEDVMAEGPRSQQWAHKSTTYKSTSPIMGRVVPARGPVIDALYGPQLVMCVRPTQIAQNALMCQTGPYTYNSNT
jgi:hypothetical protein